MRHRRPNEVASRDTALDEGRRHADEELRLVGIHPHGDDRVRGVLAHREGVRLHLVLAFERDGVEQEIDVADAFAGVDDRLRAARSQLLAERRDLRLERPDPVPDRIDRLLWMGGCMLGAMSGLAPGVVRGAMLGAKGAAGASQRWSDAVGSYEEVLIGVPDVMVRGDRVGRRHFFVLQMYTDSALARWGDRAFAFGYRKQMAQIQHELFRSIRVEEKQQVLLEGEFVNEEQTRWKPAAQITRAPRLLATLRQPLLAVTEDGRLARSHLQRDLTASEVSAASGAVRVAGGFAPGVPAQEVPLGDGPGKQPWGGFHTRKIMSRVSYPTHLPALRAALRPAPGNGGRP